MSEQVPEGWAWHSLDELVGKITSGGTPKVGNQDYYNGNIPFLKIRDLTDSSRTVFTSEESITEKAIAETSSKIFPKGTVVTTMYGTIGVTRFLGKPMATNQAIAAFLEPKKVVDEFLFHVINNDAEKLSSFSSQTTQANISATVLKQHRVLTPPLVEQKKIASILTSVDEVIENTQKQIDKLQDLKKATMNELLTKGIGHTEFKDSELGKIPKSWEVEKLGDFSVFRNGLNFSQKNKGAGLKIIGVSDFKNYEYPQYADLSEINPDGIIREDDYLNENDFIFVRSNGNRNLIGRPLFIKNIGARKVSYSGFVIRCRIDFSKKITPDFCNCIFNSSLFKKKIHDAGAGTNISNLSQELLSEIFIPFPPLEEQRKISKVLNSMSKRTVNLETKLVQAEALKKSLMQDLLTGKVRVQVN